MFLCLHLGFKFRLMLYGFFTLIAEMKRGTPTLQRSLARLLGVVDWTTHLSVLPDAINYLLDKVHSAVSYVA